MRVLITGVAGLIGSRFADWLSGVIPTVEIIGVDDLSGGYRDNINPQVTFHNVSLLDPAIDKIFDLHKPDIVYHFAAYAAVGLSPFIRRHNYENNLICTVNIINNCINHDVRRLVFTSSMDVYGFNEPPFHEDMPCAPIDPYGIAKMACEADIKVAGDQHNLDWCIIRPHNVFGEKQNIWDKYRNVLGIWMYQHLEGQPLSIFGDGEQRRAFSYVGDCSPCFWKAGIESGPSKQIINLGGIKFYSINEAADILIDIMGGGTKEYHKKRYEVKDAWSTYEKSIQLLGYEDRTSLSEGLEKMWQWAKRQLKRKRKIWDQCEISKGMYDFWNAK